MNQTLIALMLVLCSVASAQVEVVYPYNPDGNADSVISAPDLLDLLPIFGGAFTPQEIMIGDNTLTDYLQEIMALLNEQSAAGAGLAFGERINLGEPEEWGPVPWDFYVHYGVYDLESDGLIMGQLFHPFYNVVLLPDSLNVQDLSHEDFDEYIVAEVGANETFTIAVRADEKLVIEGTPSALENDFVLQWIPLLSDDASFDYNEVAPDESGPCQGELTVNYHGHDYELVEIGDQCWFAENARYLPFVSGPDIQDDILPRAYVVGYYGSDVNAAVAAADFDVFGSMYNFIAVKEWPVCPSGWRVPFTSDFMELIAFVGEDDSRKLREVGTLQNGLGTWYENSSGNCNGTDDFGFGAVAAPPLNGWSSLGYTGYYWTASHYYNGDGAIQLHFASSNCPSSFSQESAASSGAVRCLRNSTHNTGSSAALCGNGIIESGEECDDGNEDPTDGCDGCQAVELWDCGSPIEYSNYWYETVDIYGQCWFAENLRTTYYANGEIIEGGLTDNEWVSTSEGANATVSEELGRVYNFMAVTNDGGLCPVNWRVPSAEDFDELSSALGDEVAGYRMKASPPLWNGDNFSGFSGQATGYKGYNGAWQGAGSATFWTSSGVGATSDFRELQSFYDVLGESIFPINYGLSVRCIKDQ